MLAEQPGLKRVISTSIFSAIHVLILVLSKDLGSALIFFVVYVVMLFVSTQKLYYLILGILLGIVAAIIAYFLFSHVQVRVETWQNPWDDINGKGYQITQSLFAIGTGGWFGLGLLGGTPKSIPLVEVDYVFSAIAEEMGVLFSLCVILICLSCFIMFMNIAMKLQDPFYRLIAVGLATVYGFQVFLTIGGGIKFIPLTGVTLPFISYGGSSILSTMIIFAIIQGLYIIRKEQDKSEKRKKRRTNSKYREEQND